MLFEADIIYTTECTTTHTQTHLRAGTYKQTDTHTQEGKGKIDYSVAGERVTKCATSGTFCTFCHHVMTKPAAREKTCRQYIKCDTFSHLSDKTCRNRAHQTRSKSLSRQTHLTDSFRHLGPKMSSQCNDDSTRANALVYHRQQCSDTPKISFVPENVEG